MGKTWEGTTANKILESRKINGHWFNWLKKAKSLLSVEKSWRPTWTALLAQILKLSGWPNQERTGWMCFWGSQMSSLTLCLCEPLFLWPGRHQASQKHIWGHGHQTANRSIKELYISCCWFLPLRNVIVQMVPSLGRTLEDLPWEFN